MASRSSRRLANKRQKFTAGGVWKGENETDPELIEGRDKHPLTYVTLSHTHTHSYPHSLTHKHTHTDTQHTL